MRTPTRDQVAGVVRQAIEDQGLTVNKAAELSHIPPASLARKLAHESHYTLTIEELSLLAPVVNATVSDLIARAERAAVAA